MLYNPVVVPRQSAGSMNNWLSQYK